MASKEKGKRHMYWVVTKKSILRRVILGNLSTTLEILSLDSIAILYRFQEQLFNLRTRFMHCCLRNVYYEYISIVRSLTDGKIL